MILAFVLAWDRSLGFESSFGFGPPKRQPLGRQVDQAARPAQYLAAALCPGALPAYTISMIDDIYGRGVAYERLLLPFSNGNGLSDIIASLKTISEDGGFEIKNLMRGNDALPVPKLRSIIDR
jgi:hypothetical protein